MLAGFPWLQVEKNKGNGGKEAASSGITESPRLSELDGFPKPPSATNDESRFC
jgi:hypothetical protein